MVAAKAHSAAAAAEMEMARVRSALKHAHEEGWKRRIQEANDGALICGERRKQERKTNGYVCSVGGGLVGSGERKNQGSASYGEKVRRYIKRLRLKDKERGNKRSSSTRKEGTDGHRCWRGESKPTTTTRVTHTRTLNRYGAASCHAALAVNAASS